MTDERTELGLSLEEGLKEALAWKRGEIALETVNLDPMRGRDAEGPYQAGSLLEHDIGVAFRSAIHAAFALRHALICGEET